MRAIRNVCLLGAVATMLPCCARKAAVVPSAEVSASRLDAAAANIGEWDGAPRRPLLHTPSLGERLAATPSAGR